MLDAGSREKGSCPGSIARPTSPTYSLAAASMSCWATRHGSAPNNSRPGREPGLRRDTGGGAARGGGSLTSRTWRSRLSSAGSRSCGRMEYWRCWYRSSSRLRDMPPGRGTRSPPEPRSTLPPTSWPSAARSRRRHIRWLSSSAGAVRTRRMRSARHSRSGSRQPCRSVL